MDNFEKKLKTAFVAEASQILVECEQHVLALEKAAKSGEGCSEETHDEIFRIAHNLKGTASASGFEPVAQFIHHIESLIKAIRSGGATRKNVSILIKSMDRLRADLTSLKADFEATLNHESLIKEIETEIQQTPQAVVTEAATVQNAPVEAPISVPVANDSVRVNIQRLDQLINLIGEMSIAQSRIAGEIVASLKGQSLFQELSKITTEIQRHSMSLRVSPIKPVFQAMTRIVRDTAELLSKDVDLDLFGEDTELDKTVLEKLSDPLMHLIRNAVDHGIESFEERRAAGKSPVGRISLSAQQVGEKITIDVKDDGQGLNAAALIAKAVQRGILSPDAVLTDAEAYQLVFAPNFSTKEEITGISGRGIGMNVVRSNITKLQGRIDIFTELGRGTHFRIELPLSLAMMEGLIVVAGTERYIIPFTCFSESFHLANGGALIRDEKTGQRSIILRGEVVPVFTLTSLLGVEASRSEHPECIAIVVKSASNQSLCLLVDDIDDSQNLVLKKLDPEIQDLPWIMGGAILGSGKPALILDINSVLESVW